MLLGCNSDLVQAWQGGGALDPDELAEMGTPRENAKNGPSAPEMIKRLQVFVDFAEGNGRNGVQGCGKCRPEVRMMGQVM